MSVEYTRINWEDSPSTQTPINAENLNTMDSAIDELAGAVNDLDGVPGEVEDLQTEIGALKNDLNQFPNGTYPNMSVGNADQLTATVGIEDNAPYLFRTSGGSNDIGDREDVRKIVGGTIVNNQLVDSTSIPATKTESGVTFTNNTDGTITVNGTATADIIYVVVSQRTWDTHKYIISGCPQVGSLSTYNLAMRGAGTDCFDFGNGNIWDASGNSWKGMVIYVKSGATVTNLVFKPNFTDLTLTFGTSIADYVYTLEQATAGAGVAWLKKHFPKQFDSGYQAYDAGSMQSVSGLTAHRMVGFNQWDEDYEQGYISSGVPRSGTTTIRSKNFCKCLPDTTYYATCGKTDGGVNNRYYLAIVWYDADKNYISNIFCNNQTAVSPSNARYFKITTNTGTVIYGGTYNHDICINFHWDGEKDGTYEPYKTWSYALDDSVVIRGIPKVDANGNLYYDGDEYLPDGTINRRYGIVTLNGTETWDNRTGYTGVYSHTVSDMPNNSNASGFANIISDYLPTVPQSNLITSSATQGIAVFTWGTQIVAKIKDITTLDAFKAYLVEHPLTVVYELATPTTETALPYQETQIVDDFGTEEFVLADGAYPVPVGHDTMYQNNLRAKLEMSPESPDGDGLYVVQQESGENTYVPLASTATIQDILTRLTALENA